jgi:hypothetical protein
LNPLLFKQLKPRSARAASRDGAFRSPSGGFCRSRITGPRFVAIDRVM